MIRRAAVSVRSIAVGVAAFGVIGLGVVSSAPAQQTPTAHPSASGAPRIPAGPGTLRGVVRHANGEAAGAGLAVVLYALLPDGTPGVENAKTDASGVFAFENITNGAETVFLIAVQYREIPFGRRIAFEQGQTEVNVTIEVSEPAVPDDSLPVSNSRFHLEAASTGVRVRVSHHVDFDGQGAVYVESALRSTERPLFRAHLPEGALDFRSVMVSLGDGLERRGNELLYWGPVYEGGQDVEYEYRLDAQPGEFAFEEQFANGSERVLVSVPPESEGGLRLHPDGLKALPPSEADAGGAVAFSAGAKRAGDRLRLAVTLPELRRSAESLSLSEGNLWLELDDTNLVVSAETVIEVDSGPSLVGDPDHPLLHIDLPPNAELMGVSPEVARIGGVRVDGGFDVLGPVPSGSTRLGYRYRVASGPDGASLDLRFERTLPVLRVLIADTGVVVETDVLHRRRPVRSGTRMYLQREAFQVPAGETVSIGLRPIHSSGVPRSASAGIMLALAVAGAWILISPLRIGRAAGLERADLSEIALQRSLVVQTIRDLDHDHETGKIDQADYDGQRQVLRARAIELLRVERGVVDAPAADGSDADARKPGADVATTGRFCPACGEGVSRGWRFCSHCGGPLAPSDAGGSGPGE